MVKQFPIRLDEELAKRIKIICIKKGTSFQETAKELLVKWVEENEGNA